MTKEIKAKFRTAEVTIQPDTIISEFNDGKVNTFYMAGKNEEYYDIAAMYGYGNDWKRYAREHELVHHFIADNLGWRWSWSLYASAGKKSTHVGVWPNHIEWEENLVNAFQAYTQNNTRDPYNVLHCVFPEEKLILKKYEFLRLVRRVLDCDLSICYNHETGDISDYPYQPTAAVLHPA